MSDHFAFDADARIPDPIDCPELPTASASDPSDATWEAYADWRPSCFGRLALEYATRFGLHVLPLLIDGGVPFVHAVPGGSDDATRDPATIRAWWTRAPRTNVGIACGPSGLLVLEVDPRGGGPETLAMHAERLGPLPPTWTARMPDGWTQCFFAHADPEISTLPFLRPVGPGVKVVHRGFVVAPPSLVRGRRSAWHFDRRPGQATLATMPAAWMDHLTGRAPPGTDWSGLDARHSLLGRAFESLGWLGRRLDHGRRVARCPWAFMHAWTGGAGGDAATVLSSPEFDPWMGRFQCAHPECVLRDEEDVLRLLPDEIVAFARGAISNGMEHWAFFAGDDELAPLARRPRAIQAATRAARELLVDAGCADEADRGARNDRPTAPLPVA